MFRTAALGTVLALAIAGSSAAADLPRRTALPVLAQPAPFSWTGFTVGAMVGYTRGETTHGRPSEGHLIKPSGVMAVLSAGYNHQFANNVVVGLELMVPVIPLSDKKADPRFVAPLPPVSYEGKVNWAVLGTAKIGYVFDRVLPYARVGMLVGQGETTTFGWDRLGNLAPGLQTGDKQTHFGYVLGAGVDYALTNNWILRAEYQHTRSFKEAYTFIPAFNAIQRFGLKTHSGLVGVNYKF